MATQIVISNKDYTNIDDYLIVWADKGNSMPALPNTIHYVIWRSSGVNEIQNKDESTNMMTGNTPLSAISDAVGSTTISALLSWGETRKGQIDTAKSSHQSAVDAGTATESETWRDYDPNYS